MKSIDLKTLQLIQQEFDRNHFDREYQNNPELAKLNHIYLHIGKLQGKLARYIERKQHGEEISPDEIIREVVPDLIIYGIQISNILNVEELQEIIIKRLDQNRKNYPAK